MKLFSTLVISDYKQRTRSYAFLITVCATLAIAYTFVPEPNASYSTISIASHTGLYNSAWFGYVTAIMSSIFVSLFGFYLVNNSIKRDVDSKVGQIVASTQIKNFVYLCSKALSNFLVLGTIAMLVFIMSIVLFFFYNDGFSIAIFQFITPYLFITLPALFFVSVLAIVLEVIFRRYTILQNCVYFFLFSFIAFSTPTENTNYALDVFGTQIAIDAMVEEVRTLVGADTDMGLNIGYVLKSNTKMQKFEFNGVDFPFNFIASRILWMLFGIGLIALATPIFHRFDMKTFQLQKKKLKVCTTEKGTIQIAVRSLTKPSQQYGVFSLLKTELLLLFRKGKKWLWIVNITGMVLLAVLPIHIAHTMVLPVLWFLQVHRVSDVTSKELFHKAHYFAFSSHKPIGRLLTSQLLAGVLFMILLALPLIIRLMLETNMVGSASVILGASCIVCVAAFFGIITKGKKLFEIVFFLITYANINAIPFLDYFGAITNSILYVLVLLLLFLGGTLFSRKRELARL